ncbi:MAG: hypothetical protein GY720_08080 [bacterium]|nr:hypothetical protein [bacterium]
MIRLSRLGTVLLALLLFVPRVAGVGLAADESTLVVDLAATDAAVEEHTARLLWNLMTDNIVRQDSEGWNSLYLEQPDTVSGEIVVDFAAGTISGEIVERWKCGGDCATADGSPSWTTTRDTGWKATITDGRVTAAGDQWTVTGKVAISYDTSVTAKETPSDCGGTPCYLCKGQVCEVAGTAASTAELEGWIEGRTLSLAFADRMEPNVQDMDLSALLRTEFFMSRFSITITPALSTAPATGQTAAPASTPPTTAAATELPAGSIIPGLGAGAPLGPNDLGEGASSTTTSTSSVAAAGSDDDSGKGLSMGSIILMIALALGVGTALILVRRLFGKKAPLEAAASKRAARKASKAGDEFFRKEASHVLEPGQVVYVPNPEMIREAKARGQEVPPGWDEPLPTSLEIEPGDPKHPEEAGLLVRALVRDGLTVTYDPSAPDKAVLRSGAHVYGIDGLTPLPDGRFVPSHELAGTKSITGTPADPKGSVEAHLPGTPVQVITTEGDRTLVRINAKTNLWVPRSSVVGTPTASAGIDPVVGPGN